MARTEDLTGRRFGNLTVVEKTDRREDNYVLWRCRCDCGAELSVSTKKLKRGTVKDCGCRGRENARRGNVAEDLTGQTFGALTVIRRAENKNGRTCWLCRCRCGGGKEVLAKDLKAGKVRSCGCLVHEPRGSRTDLSGRRFGRLTVIRSTDRRDGKGCVYWLCRCDCGNEVEVTGDKLLYGNYRSCGCLKEENMKMISQRSHRIDGTCIEILENRKHRSDNRSGFRGVFRIKSGKYRVDIGFKRKKYYIGVFDDYNEAVQARLYAEHLVHDRFVEAYHEWKDRADRDPKWGEEHPLKVDIDWKEVFSFKN